MPKKKAAKKVTKNAPGRSAPARSSVGRPKGSGKFGCETKVIRVPSHLVESIYDFVAKKLKADSKTK